MQDDLEQRVARALCVAEGDDPPSVRDTWQAALQHAVDVVKGAPGGGSGDHIRRAAILTAFGAGGRNA